MRGPQHIYIVSSFFSIVAFLHFSLFLMHTRGRGASVDQHAHTLAPNDFQIAKKVLQALHALGRVDETGAARQVAIEIWRKSTEPRLRKLQYLIFHQFKMGRLHIHIKERLAPKGDHDRYAWVVYGPDNKRVGTIQLESTAASRKMGDAYFLSVYDAAGKPSSGKKNFASLPTLSELDPIVRRLISERLKP